MTNKINTVLYVGVTDNLVKRVYQHKNKLASDFTSKYNIDKLVYYEVFEDINEAIKREKKLKLIQSMNPQFNDLYNEIIQ